MKNLLLAAACAAALVAGTAQARPIHDTPAGWHNSDSNWRTSIFDERQDRRVQHEQRWDDRHHDKKMDKKMKRKGKKRMKRAAAKAN